MPTRRAESSNASQAADSGNLRARYGLGLVLLNEGHTAEALPQFAFVCRSRSDRRVRRLLPGPMPVRAGRICRRAGRIPAGAGTRSAPAQRRVRRVAGVAAARPHRTGAAAARRLPAARDGSAQRGRRIQVHTHGAAGRGGDDRSAARAGTKPRPAGPCSIPTPIALGPAGTAWRRFDASHPASITAADIDGDGQVDIFIAGAIEDGGGTRNAVLFNRGAAGFVLDTVASACRGDGSRRRPCGATSTTTA